MDEPASRLLLVLDSARIALPDGTLLPPLSARATGDRLSLVGGWDFLFRLLTRTVTLASGQLEIAGVRADQALERGTVGVAPAEPVLVAAWTLRRYLTESAALSAVRRAAPAAMANDVIRRFGFESLAERRLGSFNDVERRAVVIVQATLGEPEVLAFERPLARVDAVAYEYLDGLIERAAAGRRLVISVLDAEGRERALLDRTTSTLVLGPGHVVLPRDVRSLGARRVLATVSRRGAEFHAALVARGLRVDPVGPVEVLSVVLGETRGATSERFCITLLDPSRTEPVIQAALESEAPLVELVGLD
jgi:ABC-type Na+ transport system ATPase subunit NatA